MLTHEAFTVFKEALKVTLSGMAGIFDSTSLGFGAVATDMSVQTSGMSADVASKFAAMQSAASVSRK